MPTIKVYSQPGWIFCQKVKEFLSQKGIEYVEKNVAVDESALAELEKLGVMSTPVTVIDGQIIIGFDQKKLEEALKKIAN